MQVDASCPYEKIDLEEIKKIFEMFLKSLKLSICLACQEP